MRLPRVVPGQIWESRRSRELGRRVQVLSATGTKVTVLLIQPREGNIRENVGTVRTMARHSIARNLLIKDVYPEDAAAP